MPYYPPDGTGTIITGAATTPIHGTVTVVPGTPNVLVMSNPSSPVTDYKHGGIYIIHPNADVPSGLTTLNISGVGAIEVVKNDTTNPATGDIPADREFTLVYNADEPQFQSIALMRSEIDFINGGEINGVDRTLGNIDAFALGFKTNNIQRISITNSGKVGINEQIPDTQLHLTKNNADAFGQLKIEQVGGGSPSIEFLRTGIRQFNLGISAVDNFFHIATGVFSAGNNKFTIDNTGKVGIGTVSPIKLLHVKSGGIPAEVTIGSTLNANSSNIAQINFEGHNDAAADITYAQIKGSISGNSAGSEGGQLSFYIINGGSLAEALRINNNGNVGINEILPDEKLHVVGNVKVVGNIIANNLGGKTINIESPTSSEDVTMFRTDFAITVQEVIAVSIGSTPSVTYQLKHHIDRSNAGNALTTSAATTSTTTGDTATLSDATIPANSWIWLETTAKSGTVDMMSIDIRFITD